ncbi:dTDP-4-dehydrorhamnose 3,5-epimerase [uncultured Tateyamaria sp.]|uniref:dTDP-4-dehydrorhamnose 3,5-epimerase n=1 Tax=uncultured Tateyamaria sp. TaxID=455651 RepID=UPI0026034556|nr:dTDP-4-dehydrorhamnose 3,5-epimerase [uncultured Tateyamaria sp.]
MQIETTPLADLMVITPARFGDARGFFSESYSAQNLAKHGIDTVFVQDNHSLSAATGTLRGLHFQAPPHAQDKLVRCGKGVLLDVAVDIRADSPTYGQWFGIELSFENGRQLLVPAGFAHGFVTRSPNTEVIYKCSDVYAPQTEGAIRWDDPHLAIDWALDGEPILSEKDAAAPLFDTLDTPFIYDAALPAGART